MLKCFGGPKRPFSATNHISGHFRPNGKSYFEKSKISKFAKKLIFVKNSNSDRVADIGRNDEIWPEMCPWGVLESFCTPIRYFIAFRSIFMKFQKMPFLTLWIIISGNFRAVRIFYGSKIGQPILAKAKTHLDPFPKNFPRSSNEYFKIYRKKSIFWQFHQNSNFWSNVVFVVFVAFWGTTMLFFQKYDISAFIGTKNH